MLNLRNGANWTKLGLLQGKWDLFSLCEICHLGFSSILFPFPFVSSVCHPVTGHSHASLCRAVWTVTFQDQSLVSSDGGHRPGANSGKMLPGLAGTEGCELLPPAGPPRVISFWREWLFLPQRRARGCSRGPPGAISTGSYFRLSLRDPQTGAPKRSRHVPAPPSLLACWDCGHTGRG